MNIRGIVKAFAIMGPAVLVSVELFDPASIVTSTASGAIFGFEILWAALYSGILLIGIQEISARLGVVTGKTLAENIYERYGKHYSYPLFATSLFLDFSTLTAEVMGLSLAISFLFGVAYSVGIAASVTLISILVYFSSYGKLERVLMLLVTTIFLAYLYFLFVLNAPLGTIALDSLVPSFKANSFYYAEAVIGASIMPTYVVLHSGLVHEKGWVHHHRAVWKNWLSAGNQ
ncbi:MAG: Nramp family divalent metal transporter [Methanomassiliicoccales archaeon]|jgi:manganese transport protein